MKADEVKRAAVLVEAFDDIEMMVADLTDEPPEGSTRFLDLQVRDRDDDDVWEGRDFVLRLDVATARKSMPLILDLIKAELAALGVTLED